MKKAELAYILKYHKWPRMWQYLPGHFMFMFLPAGLLLVDCSMWYGGFTYGHIYENHFMNDFFATALSGFIFSLFFLIYFAIRIKNQRVFREIITSKNYTINELFNIVHQLDWKVSSNYEKNSIQVTTRVSAFSWGERITIIILNNNTLLFNSRPTNQPVTIGKDDSNLKKFLAKDKQGR